MSGFELELLYSLSWHTIFPLHGITARPSKRPGLFVSRPKFKIENLRFKIEDEAEQEDSF